MIKLKNDGIGPNHLNKPNWKFYRFFIPISVVDTTLWGVFLENPYMRNGEKETKKVHQDQSKSLMVPRCVPISWFLYVHPIPDP